MHLDLAKLMSMPPVGSSHGADIDTMIYLVHIVMVLLFIGWGIFFLIVLVRFNRWSNPRADYHGVKSHVSSSIEIAVAVVETVLLVGFSIPFWAKQVNAFPDRPDSLEVHVIAEQFAWNVHYPGPDGIFGKTDLKFLDKQSNPVALDPNDPHGKDDITALNNLYLPVGRPAIIHLTSRDVMHSFGLNVMRVKQDVIPGLSIPTWFVPTMTSPRDKPFEIACAQLCGIGHYRMKGYLHIMSEEDYQKWLDEQAAANKESEDSGGDDFWN